MFTLAAFALMLSGCSSDDTLDGGKKQDGLGAGYVSLSISMPTVTSTPRADEDQHGVDFQDGTTDEYEVKTAALVLFKGASEAVATIVEAYDITPGFSNYEDTPNQITATQKIVQRVAESSSSLESNKYYALVLLNYNQFFNISSTSIAADGTLTPATMTFTSNFGATAETCLGKTLAQFQDLICKEVANNTAYGFLMMNAALADKQGSTTTAPTDATVHYLTEIAASKVYTTQAAATANPAAEVFVERAMAKVTLIDGTTGEKKMSGEGLTSVAYDIKGWVLDLYNTNSYALHNTAEFGTWSQYVNSNAGCVYRFIGSTPVKTDVTLYRTYWGKDVQGNGAADATYPLTQDKSAYSASTWKATGTGVDYCWERLPNVANFKEKEATRAIVAVQLGDGTSFYTVNGGQDIYTNMGDLKKLAANAARIEFSDPTIATTQITITDPTDGDGACTITCTVSGETKTVTSITMSKYLNGIAYYYVPIRHFDNTLVPNTGATLGNLYPGGDQNQLGRYGVLRNNWYELSVKGVKYIGSAEYVEPGATPLDEIEGYIAVEINILSWAKRNQSVEL